MKLKEYDRIVNWYNMQINILEWDRDFISPASDVALKNDLINAVKINKHKFILDNFKCIPPDTSHAYKLLRKDYLFSYGLPDDLENEVAKAMVATIRDYHFACEKNDYGVVAKSLDKLISLKREEYSLLDISALNNYDKTLQYFCGDYFSAKIDKIMSIIYNGLVGKIKYSDSLSCVQNSVVSVAQMKAVFERYGVALDKIVFQEDHCTSCLQLSPFDCRLTFERSIKQNAARHEMGHILYMQNISTNFDYYVYCKPLSLVFDEAVATLYELLIDSNYTFSADKCRINPIRIECVDITRLLHIYLRYEMEKGMINGTISGDLKKQWDKMFKKYLDIKPVQIEREYCKIHIGIWGLWVIFLYITLRLHWQLFYTINLN